MLRKFVYVMAAFVLSAPVLWMVGCGDDDGGGEVTAVCGNDICEEGETAATCPEDCGCGNNILNEGEECDKFELDGKTCGDFGYEGGTLLCSDQCTFDLTKCSGGGVCGNGLIDDNEDCDSGDLGGTTCEDLGFQGGVLSCINDTCEFDTSSCCDGDCDEENARACDGEVVITCTMAADGCLYWQDTEDCAANDPAQFCVLGICEDPCESECDTLDELRCNGNVIEICVEAADGCYYWEPEEDCTDNGEICVDSEGVIMCEGITGGDSCDDPIVVDSFPYQIGTADFTANFTDTQNYSSSDSCGTANGADAFFLVNLFEGESMRLWELGGLDVVIRVISDCDPDVAECLLSFDYGEVEGEYFTAPADGDYIVVLEAWSSTPWSVDYEFHMDIIPPETDCNDGIDNDGDGLTDCEDPDCFGETGCETETICDDGFDNDGDGLTDCDDPDCENQPVCVVMEGLWERFKSDNENDLEGCILLFTPEVDGYSYSYDCTSGDLQYTPGQGNTTTELSFGSIDDTEEYTFTSGDFEFYGVTYTSLFVNSNGNLTFGEGDTTFSFSTISSVFSLPRIMLLAVDLDNTVGGTITVDEYDTGHLVMTYDDVPRYFNNSSRVVLQAVLNKNNGDITLISNRVDDVINGVVGIVNGGQSGDDPPQTDFVPPMPKTEGDLVITEIMYNPVAVSEENGEYIELYNNTDKHLVLSGCVLENETGTHTIGEFMVEPFQHFVMGRNDDPDQNGGISGVYSYGSDIQLDNGGDSVAITCQGTLIDGVDFTAGWPGSQTQGVSIQLNDYYLNDTDNDDPDNWCESESAYGDGDLGTPGSENSTCSTVVLIEESFDSFPPEGWSVEDGGDTTDTWAQCDGTSRVLSNATGSFACVDSDSAGTGVEMEEGLITPSMNCTGYSSVKLQFLHYYYDLGVNDFAYVDISTDGGTSWTNIVTYEDDTANSELAEFDISAQAAGEGDVKIRFRYVDGGSWAWYWLIDDVVVVAD